MSFPLFVHLYHSFLYKNTRPYNEDGWSQSRGSQIWFMKMLYWVALPQAKHKKNDTLHVCICKYTSFCNRTVEYNTSLFNPLKTKSRLRPTSYRAVNTFHLGYKNQSVYAVSGTSRCLFSDKYKTHKYSVSRTYNCWMLNCWCITWPVGFKRLFSGGLNWLNVYCKEV